MHANRTSTSHRIGRIPNLVHSGGAQPLHSFAFRSDHRVARGISLTIIAIVIFVATFAGAIYADLSLTTGSRAITIAPTSVTAKNLLPLDRFKGKPINILLLGQDTRSGSANQQMGGTADEGEHNADTTMILQIGADRKFMNLVSIPRDTIVSVPACSTGKDTIPARSDVMFNSIFAYGYQHNGITGAATCATQAVTHLTGIHLNAFAVVDFSGMRNMIDALGGVDVCIPETLSDDYTNLRLAKGWQHLDGTSGTQYARVRHGQGAGDGSDIMRTARQQYLIKQLVRQALAKNLLTNSAELYQFAKSAIAAVQLSPNLADVSTLAGLAASLRHISVSDIYSRTAPVAAWSQDPNRVVFGDSAKDLWAAMREGKRIDKPDDSSSASSDSSSDSSDSSASDSTSANGTDGSSTGSNSSSSASAASTTVAGLTKQADGTLVDPKTGGIVDPQTGYITDATTGQHIGIADTYLNEIVCGVKSDSKK